MTQPQPHIPGTTPYSAVRLVAARELNTRLRTKSFVIGTAVILVAFIGIFALQGAFFGGKSTSTIGFTGQATKISSVLEKRAERIGVEVETKQVASLEQGRQKIKEGELDALVSGSVTDLTVFVESELDQQIRGLLAGIAQSQALRNQLAEAGLDPSRVLGEVNRTGLEITALDPADPQQTQRQILGMVIVFLMLMSIMLYGQYVTMGVVEEKSSRMIEILLSTVRPWQLMLGKVIGVGLVGLIQLAIIGTAGLVLATNSGLLTISGAATGVLVWGLVWYLLGFFLYATIFAAAGSLISRQEDMQAVTTPVMVILFAAYFVGFNIVMSAPDSTAATILSLVPVFSPIIMPGLIAVNAAAPWEIGLAVVLTLAAIALVTWLGAKVYRGAVLHTGSRVKLRTALRS